VPVGVKTAIIGRNVRPMTKLEAQFVAVAIEEPRERTERGNNLAIYVRNVFLFKLDVNWRAIHQVMA
jgi:hypothetical protein